MRTIHVNKGFDLRFAEGLAYLTLPSAQIGLNAEFGGGRHVYRIQRDDMDDGSASQGLEVVLAGQIRIMIPVSDLQGALLPHMNGVIVRVVSGSNRDVARLLAVMDSSRGAGRSLLRSSVTTASSRIVRLSPGRPEPVIHRQDTGAGVDETPLAG